MPRYMMPSSGQTGARFILDSDRVPAKARALGDKETKKNKTVCQRGWVWPRWLPVPRHSWAPIVWGFCWGLAPRREWK